METRKRRFQTPHTYVIIFGIIVLAWLITFMVPAGKYTTHTLNYQGSNGETLTRQVLEQDSFRYMHPLKPTVLKQELQKLLKQEDKLQAFEVDAEALPLLIQQSQPISLTDLADLGLEESELYEFSGDKIYDTSQRLHKTATIWGTPDHGGFGFLNYIFEGLVTGDRYGSAIGIVALLLVVGGAFGIIMKTGAIDAGIYAFVQKAQGKEFMALPLIFFMFSFAGATFGASEQVIPFLMIMAPFCVALGYDSITAVTITFGASQIGNACSWMSPFSIAIAQGIAGLPALSGAGFRIAMWILITTASCLFMLRYARKIKQDPKSSPSYHTDQYFRQHQASSDQQEVQAFTVGHKAVLAELLLGLGWIVYGVMKLGFSIPELASQFFLIGLGAGIIALIFKLDQLSVNDLALAFKDGIADLAPTAVVVGMAKGILLVLGGSEAGEFSSLNTILFSVGNLLSGVPSIFGAYAMYIFQSLFNLIVTSNSGQAALTMPIMAPLADIVGISRQVAVLAFQLGSGFVDAFTPVSASLVGCLAAARVDWSDWAKFQIKMQGFLFALGILFITIAMMISYQ
ncbi:putative basic amino acid antiporter YfcC [Vaginisenegalia massiliensis]|uniref:putative basic amino acid antiporter YfcC n=1 Tax=Vaginisenegalia massiliensis TaxID=2058294 RepID=UPI000F53EB45|nr:putative basic amino acid antiporter YfcC [Vaginisenegalia massiliensis]